MIRVALLIILALYAGLAPDSAAACSVCYAGAEESRKAFLLTTLLLSVLPLAMFGSLFWWVRRRFRELDQTRVEASIASATLSVPVGLPTGPAPRSTRID